jgi:hypothetical protein
MYVCCGTAPPPMGVCIRVGIGVGIVRMGVLGVCMYVWVNGSTRLCMCMCMCMCVYFACVYFGSMYVYILQYLLSPICSAHLFCRGAVDECMGVCMCVYMYMYMCMYMLTCSAEAQSM